ncbi:MAG: hypothetical protein KatS3mg087_1653 [Patescibacteria group bacterium]|nr:MAG: hypothetical protein KatS3mg087_1653 [Patescibacteria group bacterium]
MTKITHLKNNFTVGEISPLLYGRTDLEQYASGARIVKNFVPLPYGGLIKRPGFRFVNEVKDSTKKVRLIPFRFSQDQAYILEFGHQYIRFYKDEGILQVSGSPYEISSPYDQNDLFNIQYAQSWDVLYLVHRKYKPKKLQRFDHTNWVLSDYTPTNDPFVINSWSASTAYSIGDRVIPTTPNGYYYKVITAGTSGTTEPSWTTTIGDTVADGSVTWRCMGTTPAEYPGTVTIFEQRLWFGGSNDEPQTVWASKSGDYDDMTIGTADDDALKYTIGSDEAHSIQWMSSGKTLMVGTIGGVFSVGSDSATTPITPTNIIIRKQSNIGSYNIMPVRIGEYIFYAQRDRKVIRQISYSLDDDAYIAADMNILAEHILQNNAVELAFQLSPYSIIWVVDSNGQLLSFTRDVLYKVSAWARHDTDGSFESVAVIPRSDGAFDEVWCVVNRTINGSTKRYVEYMENFKLTDQLKQFFVDSGLSYSGAATNTVSGLSHLEGKTVNICANGGHHPPRTVSGGSITLDDNYTDIHVGLAYTSEVEMNIPDAGSATGTAQSKYHKISDIWVKLHNSLGGEIGFGSDTDEILYRTQLVGQQMPQWFSGFKRVIPQLGTRRELYPKIIHSNPLQFILLEVVTYFEVAD